MVKIKLAQTGNRNRKTYRIVVMEEGKRRDGKSIEILGYYNPLVKPAELKFDTDRVKYWISVGAKPTESIQKLLKLT
jgi:small subunit ribosomal protein S16